MKTKYINSLYRIYLKQFLYSPVTYLTSICFLVFTVLRFYLGGQFFSEYGTTDLHNLFSIIPYISIIIIPTLTGVISFKDNELSLSVSSYSHSVARWISLMTVLSFITLLTLSIPIAITFFGNIEISLLCCGYIGIFLYLCTVSSITILIFILVQNTVSSLLISVLVLSIFNSSHLIPLYFRQNETMAAILRSISFAWHFDAAGKGIIDTRDFVFFIVITFCALYGGYISVEHKRGYKFSLTKNKFLTVKSLLYLLISILILQCNTMNYYRIDTTQNKRFSISEYSKTLLQEAEENLDITYYCSSTLRQLYPQVSDVREYLTEYSNLSKKVSFIVKNPNEKDSDSLTKYGIYPQQIQTAGRDKTSFTNVYSSIVINYLDKTEIIPFVLDTSTLEYDLTGRISSLLRQTKRQVQIVVGNGLSLQNDYSYLVPWLESQGFNVIPSNLPLNLYPTIPLLVIGTSMFTGDDTEALETFILNGGKTIIATTPYSINLNGEWEYIDNKDKVCRLLKNWGIILSDTITADISNFRLTMISDSDSQGNKTNSSSTESINYSMWPVLLPQTNAIGGLTLFWPCSITTQFSEMELSLIQIENMLTTTQASWNVQKNKGIVITNPFIAQKTPEQNDKKGPFFEALKFKGKLNGYYTASSGATDYLFVIGDQYALSTLMLGYTAGTKGDFRAFEFITDRLLEANNQKVLISLKNKSYINNTLYKKSIDEIVSLKNKTIFLSLFIPLLIVLLTSIIVLVRRKIHNAN